nr:13965_t:CDS:2 [Entrophospora candida]CAG8596258.1 1312_t:CDS:2 [Entrophospora candida]
MYNPNQRYTQQSSQPQQQQRSSYPYQPFQPSPQQTQASPSILQSGLPNHNTQNSHFNNFSSSPAANYPRLNNSNDIRYSGAHLGSHQPSPQQHLQPANNAWNNKNWGTDISGANAATSHNQHGMISTSSIYGNASSTSNNSNQSFIATTNYLQQQNPSQRWPVDATISSIGINPLGHFVSDVDNSYNHQIDIHN